MDIRGPVVDRLVQNKIHKPNHRRGARRLLDALFIRIITQRKIPRSVDLVLEGRQHVVHSSAVVTVELIDAGANIVTTGQHERNITRQHEHQLVHDFWRDDVTGCHFNRGVGHRNRNHIVHARHAGRDAVDDVTRDVDRRKVDHVRA